MLSISKAIFLASANVGGVQHCPFHNPKTPPSLCSPGVNPFTFAWTTSSTTFITSLAMPSHFLRRVSSNRSAMHDLPARSLAFFIVNDHLIWCVVDVWNEKKVARHWRLSVLCSDHKQLQHCVPHTHSTQTFVQPRCDLTPNGHHTYGSPQCFPGLVHSPLSTVRVSSSWGVLGEWGK